MASIQAIGKAKLTGAGLKGVFGVEPNLDIQDEYVRVYYNKKKLPIAQKNFNTLMESKPGEVRTEITPVITPYMVKKVALPAFGIFLFGYAIGKTL